MNAAKSSRAASLSPGFASGGRIRPEEAPTYTTSRAAATDRTTRSVRHVAGKAAVNPVRPAAGEPAAVVGAAVVRTTVAEAVGAVLARAWSRCMEHPGCELGVGRGRMM
ncbi:hypothetical protein ACE1SV_05510 [Streptomyces sp. E-15]